MIEKTQVMFVQSSETGPKCYSKHPTKTSTGIAITFNRKCLCLRRDVGTRRCSARSETKRPCQHGVKQACKWDGVVMIWLYNKTVMLRWPLMCLRTSCFTFPKCEGLDMSSDRLLVHGAIENVD